MVVVWLRCWLGLHVRRQGAMLPLMLPLEPDAAPDAAPGAKARDHEDISILNIQGRRGIIQVLLTVNSSGGRRVFLLYGRAYCELPMLQGEVPQPCPYGQQ